MDNTSIKRENINLHLHDGEAVSGILTTPESPKGFVLILQGSGNVGADGDVSSPFLGSGYQGQVAAPSAEIAEQLAAIGIASFRYAKRGCEKADQLKNQTIPFLKKDASSAFRFLEEKFPRLKSGVIGLSEGAILALMLSTEMKVDFLCVMGLPTRKIDEILHYQFLTWPVELISKKLTREFDGIIPRNRVTELKDESLPLGQGTWNSLLSLKEGDLSIEVDILPLYKKLHDSVKALILQEFGDWYRSMQETDPLSQIIPEIRVDQVYLYHAEEDAQVPVSWISEDLHYFKKKPKVRIFSGLGHCFSPMEGTLGEQKTSGPIDTLVLSKLLDDVSEAIKSI